MERRKPPRAGAMPASDLELARLARALGHPARVAIMRILLHRGECLCGQIVESLPLAQATVSQHLKVLKEADFILGEVDGPRVCYGANPTALERMRKLLASMTEEERRSR